MTRLPPPARRTPGDGRSPAGGRLSAQSHLGAKSAASLFAKLEAPGIAGGAVYDALVGAAAREHRLRLATRDRRALETYRDLDVAVELLS